MSARAMTTPSIHSAGERRKTGRLSAAGDEAPTMQVQWAVRAGLPEPPFEALASLGTRKVHGIEHIRHLCAANEDCVGFAYRPSDGAWYPKQVDQGGPRLSTRSYAQPHPGEVWEFHSACRREDRDSEEHRGGGPRLRVWLEGVEQFPHVRQREGLGSCCVPLQRLVCASISTCQPQGEGGLNASAETARVMSVCGEQEESGDAVFEFDEDDPFEVSLDGAATLRFDATHLVGRRRKKHSMIAKAGYTTIAVKDLARQTKWRLMLFQEASGLMAPDEAVYGTDHKGEEGVHVRQPTFIRVRTQVVGCDDLQQHSELDFLPRMRPTADFEPRRQATRPTSQSRQQRVMLVTRGTRGDVQPFVALARGLALPPFNCEVTIVTELCNKEFVKKGRVGLLPGSLRFRPSGGNTPKYLDSAASQFMMSFGQDVDLIQSFFFGMAEATMFNSEGACFYWASVERPDFLVFGFNMSHIAMIISEALEIPIVGFFLQPTRKVEKRMHSLTFVDEILMPFREKVNGSTFNAVLMQVFDQLNTTGESLYFLRKSRGLTSTPLRLADEDLHFKELLRQSVPMVVPIHSLLVEGQTQEGMTYTDFIFLRLTNDKLSDDVSEFIDRAKGDGRQVGVMTFSSMPIGLRRMLDVAFEVCEKAAAPSADARQPGREPALIVMGAGQDVAAPATAEQAAKVEELQRQGRLLLLLRGQPFGALFPRLDFAIMHGGLGVTSEALLAGVPVITSGIQLLDQRWWGARMADLGCGSAGIPFARLLRRGESSKSRILEQMGLALDRRGGGNGPLPWHQKVQQVKQQITPPADDPDGVTVNARAVYLAGTERSVPIAAAYESEVAKNCCDQAECCYRTCKKCTFLWVVQVPLAFGSACYNACSRCCCLRRRIGGVGGQEFGFVRSKPGDSDASSDSGLDSDTSTGSSLA